MITSCDSSVLASLAAFDFCVFSVYVRSRDSRFSHSCYVRVRSTCSIGVMACVTICVTFGLTTQDRKVCVAKKHDNCRFFSRPKLTSIYFQLSRSLSFSTASWPLCSQFAYCIFAGDLNRSTPVYASIDVFACDIARVRLFFPIQQIFVFAFLHFYNFNI